MNYCRDCKYYIGSDYWSSHKCKLARPPVKISPFSGKDENAGIYHSPTFIRPDREGAPCEKFKPTVIGSIRMFFREVTK